MGVTSRDDATPYIGRDTSIKSPTATKAMERGTRNSKKQFRSFSLQTLQVGGQIFVRAVGLPQQGGTTAPRPLTAFHNNAATKQHAGKFYLGKIIST